MKKIAFIVLFPLYLFGQNPSKSDLQRWQRFSNNVTIIRDNYGIPHIYGKSDADAVFGLLYAQCEDDFPRVEMNYLEKLGRIAEVKGEQYLYGDLLNKILIDTAASHREFESSPVWLKELMNAFADGINYYLYKHPETKPALLTHFEPWFPLMWTDGSIGAISTADISMREFKEFFSHEKDPATEGILNEVALTGSNGFAFGPAITKNKTAILYINPHTSIYFRPEVHINSEEGLNAYGAVTWGQFFIYQGFNPYCGWMHPTSYNDAADSYIEKLSEENGEWSYEYEGKRIRAVVKEFAVVVKNDNGSQAKRFKVVFTGHGPVIAKRNGQYLSLKADNRIYSGLVQCWQRTKSRGLEDYKKTMDLKGNFTNNTVYADIKGNIAFWHGDRIPIRDEKYDWSKPVDGSISATEWKGYYDVKDIVQSINPANGWLQNCNSNPFAVAGNNSPDPKNYPYWLAYHDENFRGVNAVRILSEEKDYTLEKVIAAGYDRRLPAFEVLIPALIRAVENTNTKTDYSFLKEPLAVLKNWDYRCGENSVATTLAVNYGEMIMRNIYAVQIPGKEKADIVEKAKYYAEQGNSFEMIAALSAVYEALQRKYGKWNIPWGEINRFQRISSDIDNKFDDALTSLPIGFTSSAWGTIPAYESRMMKNSSKRYGSNGNSFICAVEFGKRIRAKSLLAGGESGDPKSPHFFDQGEMYTKGRFKDVLFYKEDVMKHVERKYHP